MNEAKSQNDVGNWTTDGCRSVAAVVGALKAFPAPATPVIPIQSRFRARQGPRGYSLVGYRIQRRICRLTDQLWHSPLDSLSQLDSANDTLLSRLESSFAELEGRPIPPPMLPPQQFQTKIPPHARPKVVRPQFLFKDPVDNSNALWKPKIKVKHNNIVPLKLELELDGEEPCGYKHPYAVELNDYTPPEELLKPKLEPPIRHKELSETPHKLIQTKAQLDELVRHLNSVTEIAVDLEHHSYRTFLGFTCLVQISTELGGDFIVDAIALREHLHSLNEPFTDPFILKVFHGADSDIIWLQRDFGVYVVGLFDTYRAAIQLNFPNKSLKGLLWKYCKITTNKRLQLADWRTRPLSDDLYEYARSDTHSLLYIWRCIRKELLDAGKSTPDRLLVVFEESKHVCSTTYVKPKVRENHAFEMSIKSGKRFNGRQITALKSLLTWRDEIARQEDESVGYVLPNHMMLQIAEVLPKETAGIIVCCHPTPPLVLHHLNTIYQMITAARMSTLDIVRPILPEEMSTETVKSIHIYNHQSLDTVPTKKTNLIAEIQKLKSLTIRPRKPSILSTKESIENVDSYNFAPPFHRHLLVKKYNDIVHKKDESTTSTEQTIVSQTITPQIDPPQTRVKDVSDKTNSDVIQTACTENKTKPRDKAVKRDAQAMKDSENLNNKITEDDDFQPFDYKSFNYNSFNKDAAQQKKRRRKHK